MIPNKKAYFLGLIAILFFTNNVSAKSINPEINDHDIRQAYQQLVKKPQKRTHLATQSDRNAPLRYQAVRIAKQQLHKKYLWGGTTPQKGFDCSGLTQYAYKKARLHLPRTALEQYKQTKRVRIKHLKVGDLIFFKTRISRQRVNHVGIYLGGGNFIHAPRRGRPVSVTKFNKYWRRKAVGAGRV